MNTQNDAPDSGALANFLSESWLLPEDVPDWKFVNKFEVNRLLGTNANNKIKCDCIAIPYHTLDGEPVLDRGLPYVRARLLEPEVQTKRDGSTSTKKYASPAGAPSQLYIPRGLKSLIDSYNKDFFIITEGEKKAEALVKIGIPAVGLSGVSMGMVRDDPSDKSSPRVVIPALFDVAKYFITRIAENGLGYPYARILVLFDSDGRPGSAFPGSHGLKNGQHVGNKNVYFEALMLAKALRGELEKHAASKHIHANVTAGWCPRGDVNGNGQPGKQGVDDWILATRNDPYSFDREIDVLVRYDAPDDRQKQLSASGGYIPLGYSKEESVIWSNIGRQITHLSASNLGKATEIMFAVGPSYALSRWQKISKNGDLTLDVQAAAADIIESCYAAGRWTESRERGGGVWLAGDGTLRINAVEGLFAGDERGLQRLSDSDRFTGEHVYSGVGDFSTGIVSSADSEPSPQDVLEQSGAELAAQLVAHLKKWGWSTSTEPYLLAGWVCQQAYVGALESRPSVILTGESGAGKTVLATHLGHILGGTARRIEDGAGTTSAGIRQRVGKSAMTLLIDEAEPASSQAQVAEQRAAGLRRTLDMIRAAYSAGDGGGRVDTTLKGSASGKAQDYSIRVAVMLNAIGKPDLEQADRNRMLILSLKKEGRGSKEPDSDGLEELGQEIRRLLWSRWSVYKAIYRHIVETDGLGEARLRKTRGGPVAALFTLTYGSAWVDHAAALEQMMRAISSEQNNTGDDQRPDHERALQMLLAAQIDCEVYEERGENIVLVNKKRMIHEVFESAKKNSPRDKDNASAQALKRVGLARFDGESGPRLFVSDNPALRSALRGTPWATGQSIVNVLSRLPGAEMTAVRPRDTRPKLAGSHCTGVFLPMPAETQPDNQPDAEETVEF